MKLNLNKKILKLFLPIAISLNTVAHAQVVTVEGMGENKSAAINEAKRTAAEMVVGSFLKSHTVVKKGQVELDDIYARTIGFVKSFEIIGESENNGIYLVRARVDIAPEYEKMVMSYAAIVADLQNPRIAISLTGRDGGNALEECYLRDCETNIVQALYTKGMTHVKVIRDKNTSPLDIQQDNFSDLPLLEPVLVNETEMPSETDVAMNFNTVDDNSNISNIVPDTIVPDTSLEPLPLQETNTVTDNKVDFILEGFLTLNTNSIQLPDYKTMSDPDCKMYDTGLIKSTSVLQLTVKNRATGETIGSTQLTGTGTDNTAQLAKAKAVSAVSLQTGEKVWEMFRQGAAVVSKGLELAVKTSDYTKVDAIAKALRSELSVQGVTVRGYENGEGIIEVETDLNPAQLFRLLRGIQGMFFNMEAHTDRTLTVSTR